MFVQLLPASSSAPITLDKLCARVTLAIASTKQGTVVVNLHTAWVSTLVESVLLPRRRWHKRFFHVIRGHSTLFSSHTCRHQRVWTTRHQHVPSRVCEHRGQLPVSLSQWLHSGARQTLLHSRAQLWDADEFFGDVYLYAIWCLHAVSCSESPSLSKTVLFQWGPRGSQTHWWALLPAHSPVRILATWKTACCSWS